MKQDEITSMAREACAPNQTFNSDEEWVKRFADLVAAHEREKCANVCESLFDADDDSCYEAEMCAAAIRARGNK